MQNTIFEPQQIEITVVDQPIVAIPKALGTQEIAAKLVKLTQMKEYELVYECDEWWYFSEREIKISNPLNRKLKHQAIFHPLLRDNALDIPCVRHGHLRVYYKVDELEYVANMLVHQLSTGASYWRPQFCLPQTAQDTFNELTK